MRIAVVSDIHGNLPALDAVLADIAREGVDVTVNLGDIVSGPLWPGETCARLMALAPADDPRQPRAAGAGRPRRAMSLTDAQTRPAARRAALRWLAALPAG